MSKKLLFFSLTIALFIGCSSNSSQNTEITVTAVSTESTNKEENNIPTLLRKPEQWGDVPNFTAVRVGGGEFKLSSLKGKVILLNFWSVGCPACKLQIPILEQLYKKYNREGLEVVGVCLDREAAVKRFTESVEMNYILILANQDIANNYGRDLRFLPFTLVIDQQGNFVQKHVGSTSISVFEKEIKELLQKTENSVKSPNTKKQDTNNNQ
ncbi:MAG: TlpA family protein disulfide reductase [Candidatus Omnitrophica bacterium]|nr:TlpA family protein disulfide reductase [Candidatus Omnitrophota bacterium]MBU1047338.1 TlpA family protein disulfide reductase [Candidatus Omnitrophota bacterium]MBU1630665.1 TlpA family protein disulfide reductase [Candidatus Omnitrophota bacterium]MBU1766818.1 TlpA family protein disulfide reductase [Candidatus Omnitrophota bacterium]MBU1889077.1 TlpA family protein disulfide reductase [Candidatus Omnitrophota bacterium]